MRLWFGRRSIVGCDVGRSAVKLVQLVRRSGKWHVVHAELHELPPGAEDPDVWPSTEAIGLALQRPWLKGEQIAVSLHAHPPVVRHVELPAIPDREVREALRWETKKATSLNIDDVLIDYVASRARGQSGERKMAVTMVVADRHAVETELRQYQQAGLSVNAIDINPLALHQVAHRVGADETGVGFLAFVDIGASHTDVEIIKHGSLRFSRTIATGGHALTQTLMQKFGIDAADAEGIKREQGLTGKAKILEVLGPEVDKMIVEIQRSIDYYRAQARDGTLEHLLLAGGTPLMPGFVEYVGTFFDAKVALCNPFDGMDCQANGALTQTMAPRFASSVGLALRGQA